MRCKTLEPENVLHENKKAGGYDHQIYVNKILKLFLASYLNIFTSIP